MIFILKHVLLRCSIQFYYSKHLNKYTNLYKTYNILYIHINFYRVGRYKVGGGEMCYGHILIFYTQETQKNEEIRKEKKSI